jgi:hypothetical protein
MMLWGAIISLLSLCVVAPVSAQSDSEHMAIAQQALLAQPPECAIADEELNRVSQAGSEDPFWVYYKAQAKECLRDYAAALQYYRQYDALVPGHPEVLERIGRIGLALARTQREEEARQAQAAAARARHDSIATHRQNLSGTWQTGGGMRLDARLSNDASGEWVFRVRFVPALHQNYGQVRVDEVIMRGQLSHDILSARYRDYPTREQVEVWPECRGRYHEVPVDLTVSADGNELQGRLRVHEFFVPDEGTTCRATPTDDTIPLTIRRVPE